MLYPNMAGQPESLIRMPVPRQSISQSNRINQINAHATTIIACCEALEIASLKTKKSRV
jgi:hypothetical protein